MPDVLTELRNGRKYSHWMWYVFPQVAGLGSSPTAQEFAIASAEEARAYLEHPVLGPRLLQCCQLQQLLHLQAGPEQTEFGLVPNGREYELGGRRQCGRFRERKRRLLHLAFLPA